MEARRTDHSPLQSPNVQYGSKPKQVRASLALRSDLRLAPLSAQRVRGQDRLIADRIGCRIGAIPVYRDPILFRIESPMSDDAPLLGTLMCQRFNQEILPQFGTQTDLERASAEAEAKAVARGEVPMGIFRQSQVSKIVREDGPAWSRLDTYSQRLHRMGIDPWLLLPPAPDSPETPTAPIQTHSGWEHQALDSIRQIPESVRSVLLQALARLASPDREDPAILPQVLLADLLTVRGGVQRADRERRATIMAETIRSQLAAEGLSIDELLAALQREI